MLNSTSCRPLPTSAAVPVMVTANEGSRHQAYAEMLGVDPRDYLRKPIPPEVLLDSVERLIGEAGDSPGGRSPTDRMKRATRRRS